MTSPPPHTRSHAHSYHTFKFSTRSKSVGMRFAHLRVNKATCEKEVTFPVLLIYQRNHVFWHVTHANVWKINRANCCKHSLYVHGYLPRIKSARFPGRLNLLSDEKENRRPTTKTFAITGNKHSTFSKPSRLISICTAKFSCRKINEFHLVKDASH